MYLRSQGRVLMRDNFVAIKSDDWDRIFGKSHKINITQGDVLKQHREMLLYSIEDLSLFTGISVSLIQEYENDVIKISEESDIRFKGIFGFSIVDFAEHYNNG